MSEILLAAIAMFIFKEGSRNALNNDRNTGEFARNFFKIFGKRLPHMDTVNELFKQLSTEELEQLKKELVKSLINRKVFYKFRLFGAYYRVAVDATGVMQVEEGHCDKCLTKTYNRGKDNEKTVYFHNVLEAKLICENGFCISLGTEWIENEDDYEKQDCEHKAFKRLAQKLKKDFPKLPICIVADGLYPNKPFFEICIKNNWEFIVTFKDGNLKSLWEDVELDLLISENMRTIVAKTIEQVYRWLNKLNYQGIELSWIECLEKDFRFVYLTSLNADYHRTKDLCDSGRLRCCIEDSFNSQKNRGYNMGHKYSRTSMQATKNYYAAMQIAHLINQLYELGSLFRPLLTGKITISHLWNLMIGALTHRIIEPTDRNNLLQRFQVRFE